MNEKHEITILIQHLFRTMCLINRSTILNEAPLLRYILSGVFDYKTIILCSDIFIIGNCMHI